MHIVFFIRNLDTGGTERQVVTLAKGLANVGHTIDIITVNNINKFKSELLCVESISVRVLWAQKSNYFTIRAAQWLLSSWKLRVLLNNIQPDVLYSMLQPINLIAWCATRFGFSNKLVWGIRASILNFSWINSFSEKLCAFISPTVPLIISNSKAGLAAYKTQGFRPKQSILIPNGINTNLFSINKNKATIFRHKINVHSETILVGIVARLTVCKDHSTFLHAASQVKSHCPNTKFVIVGNGPSEYKVFLQKLSSQLGLSEQVVWLGETHDIVGIYNALDILVSSSSSEGFSNVIGEAMACGTPCIATDVGDSANIIGDTGIIVPPNNASTLSTAIRTLIDSDRKTLSKNAHDRIRSEYSVSKLISETENVFNFLG